MYRIRLSAFQEGMNSVGLLTFLKNNDAHENRGHVFPKSLTVDKDMLEQRIDCDDRNSKAYKYFIHLLADLEFGELG